jgi:hypothetical protein
MLAEGKSYADFFLFGVMATYGYICDYIRHRWLYKPYMTIYDHMKPYKIYMAMSDYIDSILAICGYIDYSKHASFFICIFSSQFKKKESCLLIDGKILTYFSDNVSFELGLYRMKFWWSSLWQFQGNSGL